VVGDLLLPNSGSSSKKSRLLDFDESVLPTMPLQILKGHTHPVYSLAISPDGSRLVSGSVDKTVKLWDVATGTVLSTLKGHSENVTKVAFSMLDGKSILTGSFDKSSCMFSPDESSQPIYRLTHADPVYSFTQRNDKTWTFADGSTFALANGDKLDKIPNISGRNVLFSPDRQLLAHDVPSLHEVRVTDMNDPQAPPKVVGKHPDITSMVWSPESDLLITASLDNTTKVWNPYECEHVATLNAHTDSVMSVAFSENGSKLACAGRDERIHLYSVSQDTIELENVLIGSLSFLFLLC